MPRKPAIAKADKKLLSGLVALSPTLDPAEALLKELHRTQIIVDAMDAEIATWTIEDISRAPDILFSGETVVTHHPEQTLLRNHLDQRKHLALLAGTALKIGLAERQIEASTEQARTLFLMVMAIIGDPDLGMNRAQTAELKKKLALRLRALDA